MLALKIADSNSVGNCWLLWTSYLEKDSWKWIGRVTLFKMHFVKCRIRIRIIEFPYPNPHPQVKCPTPPPPHSLFPRQMKMRSFCNLFVLTYWRHVALVSATEGKTEPSLWRHTRTTGGKTTKWCVGGGMDGIFKYLLFSRLQCAVHTHTPSTCSFVLQIKRMFHKIFHIVLVSAEKTHGRSWQWKKNNLEKLTVKEKQFGEADSERKTIWKGW